MKVQSIWSARLVKIKMDSGFRRNDGVWTGAEVAGGNLHSDSHGQLIAGQHDLADGAEQVEK